MGAHRILQVLANPDPSPATFAAVELHRWLATEGWDVRTVAAAPGRRRGLQADIPPMAHSARSFAAVTQFRRESEWADAVLLRGRRTSFLARFAGRATAWCIDDPLSRRLGVRSKVEMIIVPTIPAAEMIGESHPRNEAVRVLSPFLAAVDPPFSDAARSAARTSLGVPQGALVVNLQGFDRSVTRQLNERLSTERVWLLPSHLDAEIASTLDNDIAEVVSAATDVVVHPGEGVGGVSIGTLKLVAAGAVPVASHGGDWVGGDRVGDDRVGGDSDVNAVLAAVERLDDSDHRTAAATAARQVLYERFSGDACGPLWVDVLDELSAL